MHVLDAAMIGQLQVRKCPPAAPANPRLGAGLVARTVGAFAAVAMAMTALQASSPAVRAGAVAGIDHAEPRPR